MNIGSNIKVINNKLVFVDKDGNHLKVDVAFTKIVNRVLNWFLDLKLYLLHLASETIPFWTIRKIIFLSSGITIGRQSTIHMGVRFFEPRGIVIGKDTKIGYRTFLDGRSKIKIGDHVDIASEVMIYNSEHNINSEGFEAIEEEVVIGDYIFIGPRSIIMPGVKIGKGAIVAGGAIVTKDVPEFSIVAGVPAKVIGERKNKKPQYSLGRSRLFQ